MPCKMQFAGREGIFCATGQPEAVARENAEKFARDYVRRPGAVLDRPLFG